MSGNDFVPNDPKTFVDRGFLTGRPLTLGGVRAMSRPTKSGDSARVGIQFFWTEIAKDGQRAIRSGFLTDGAWNDQMEPSDNLRGLVPVNGAERPFIEKNSPLGLFNASLSAAGCPGKLMTGDYTKLVGIEVQLEEKALPSFGRKKSVDPDEAPAPKKEFKTEVVSKIVNLPADNTGYEKLTEKEMTAHLKERADKMSARKAANGADEAPAEDADVSDDEEPKPAKKGKKALVEDDDDVVEDDSAPADDDSFGSDDAADDDAAPEPDEDPAEALATKLLLKVLKAEKKGVKGASILQKVHPLLAGTDKKTTQKVLKFVTSKSFISGIDGVTIKKDGVVVLA